MRGARPPAAAALLIGLALALAPAPTSQQADDRHPVSMSEYHLRSSVGALNRELRQLKRDFMRDMTDVYLLLRLDPDVGLAQASKGERPAPTLVALLAAEFAQLAIKRHIILRRLVQGLKVAFVKMLPVRTLRRLAERYQSYAWLAGQSAVDYRPKFPEAAENQLVRLNALIELRARVRAADDLVALTEENVRRVLQAVQFWLIESKHGAGVSAQELNLMAAHARRVLDYYLEQVQSHRSRVFAKYEQRMESSRLLFDMVGGRAQLAKFMDQIIDVEGLDIELNQEARALEMPPTINEEMIANLEAKWIPSFVLSAVGEDRSLLIENRRFIRDVIAPDERFAGSDLNEWAFHAVRYLCSNSAVPLHFK